jgi:hypothetical protein
MATFADLLTPHNIDIPEGLTADTEIPVLAGPQRQGDVAIIPRPALGHAEHASAQPVPIDGITVVRGETAGGNAHILLADGPCTWTPHAARAGDVLLGVLNVSEGEEHGANAVGPGTYRLVGKREQADELRRVAD